MTIETHVFLKDAPTISLAKSLGYELKWTTASPHPYLTVWAIEQDFGGKLVLLRPSRVAHLPSGHKSRNESLSVQPSAIAAILVASSDRPDTLPPGKKEPLRKVRRRI